jgi:hydroxyisourate hydrolase
VAEGRPTISTHVLDLERGLPAAGVHVTLVRPEDERRFGPMPTDSDGRIRDLLGREELRAGAYELSFDAAAYGAPFFLRATVAFRITDTSRSYHVPLLLSPFGLSTYRGS